MFCCLLHGLGQQTDLSFQDLMAIVQQHHPLSIEAGLRPKFGEAATQSARGDFDPEVDVDLSQKYYKDDQYYDLLGAGLKVPTWVGVDLRAGFQNNTGDFANPQPSTPDAGLVGLGISVPIGQGLFIDKRRAELKKAKLFQESTEIEQRLLVNELLYEAGTAYWSWFQANEAYLVFEEALELAQVRENAVKVEVSLGDRPAIDTLEAGIQRQDRQLKLQQAELDLMNSRALLSVYLWQDGQIPLELDTNTVPVSKDDLAVSFATNDRLAGLDSAIAAHPYLQQFGIKIDMLDIERRYRAELLKPRLDLKYDLITEPEGANILGNASFSDYTWGFQFNMPILLRRERGDLNRAKLRLQEADLQLKDLRQNIDYEVNAAINEWNTTRDQANLFKVTVQDYLGLLEGERLKFSAGESSLFLVNSRELGYINAQVKYLELLTNNQNAELRAIYALGSLPNPDQ